MMFFIEFDGIDDTLPPIPAMAPARSLGVFLNGFALNIASSNTCAGGCSLQYSNSSLA